MRTKMILAWPTTAGNNYQHWTYFVCDFERGIVWDRVTKFDDDPCGLSFRYSEYRNESDRLMEMVFPKDKKSADPHFITNGYTHEPYFFDRESDTRGRIDCRFKPVYYHYLSGMHIGMREFERAKWSEYYADSEYLDKLLRNSGAIEDRYYSGHRTFEIKNEASRLMLCAEFNKVFNRMEPSQVKFCLTSHRRSEKRNATTLRGLFKAHLQSLRTRSPFSESGGVDRLTEALDLDTPVSLVQVKKAIERRARKHPSATRATTNLLKLLNASKSISAFSAKLKAA
jgi:hypothetical protein